MRRLVRRRSESGFTLPELLIVVIILGVIAVPLADSIYAGFHDTSNVATNYQQSHDLNTLTSFLDTDVQSASGAYTSVQSPVQVDLNAVTFPKDANDGWAVGDHGYIIHTSEGAGTWEMSPQHDYTSSDGVTGNLNDVAVGTDNLTGWAVGDGGAILATSDGGTTWTKQSSGTTSNLTSVWMWQSKAPITTKVWAATAEGSVIYTSCTTACSSSSLSWSKQTKVSLPPLAAVSLDPGGVNGLAVGSGGQIVATAKGGTDNWNFSKTVGSNDLTGVQVKDANHAWAVGKGGTILECSNKCMTSGAVWAQVQANVQWPSTCSQCDLTGVWATGNYVWAVGASGTMLVCTTGCSAANATFAPPVTGTGTESDLSGIAALDTTHAWAVGATGTILSTTATVWAPQASGTSSNIRAVDAQDNNHVLAVGDNGTMLLTTNAGGSWQSLPCTGACSGQQLNAVDVLSGNAAWVVGNSSTIGMCSSNCTSPNGAWTFPSGGIAPTGGPFPNANAVAATDPNDVWVVGQGGSIWSCSANCLDPSNNSVWTLQTVGTSDLNAVVAMSNTNVWAVGANCTIEHYNGTSWSAQTGPSSCTGSPSSNLTGITTDGTNLWAVGSAVNGDSMIMFSSNKGSKWAEQCGSSTTGACPTANDLTGISYVSGPSPALWASATGGVVATCTSNCNSATNAVWVPQDTQTGQDLLGITSGTDANHAWAVGASGLIGFYSGPGKTVGIWGSDDDADSLTIPGTPVCPDQSSFLLDLSWSNDQDVAQSGGSQPVGDTAVTYYVNNGQLYRELCTRPIDAAPTDPFTPQSTVVVAHYVGSASVIPACLVSGSCASMPQQVGIQVTPTQASGVGGENAAQSAAGSLQPYIVTATRRTP